MTINQFRARHPEFKFIGDEMLQAYLDEAALEISSEVFGTVYDAAHRCLTAHKLAMTPMGRTAKLSTDDGNTVYKAHFMDLVRKRASGYRVI